MNLVAALIKVIADDKLGVWRKGTEGWSVPFKQKTERGRKYDDICGFVWEDAGEWHWQLGGGVPGSVLRTTKGEGTQGTATSLEAAKKSCEKAWQKYS
jgi:hypothetical protein